MSNAFYREDVVIVGDDPGGNGFVGNQNLKTLTVRCSHHAQIDYIDMAFVGSRTAGKPAGMIVTALKPLGVIEHEYLCTTCGCVRRFVSDPEHGVRELDERKLPVGSGRKL